MRFYSVGVQYSQKNTLMSGSTFSYSAIFPEHQLWCKLQHLSTASNLTHQAQKTDKGPLPPMASERTVINEATPVESGSVILHFHSSLLQQYECQQVTNGCQVVLCYTFPKNITLLITSNTAFTCYWYCKSLEIKYMLIIFISGLTLN